MNRSSEIKIIFKNQLTEELINLIINFERDKIIKESLKYWMEIMPIYKLSMHIIYHKRYYHLSHIKRINGSIKNVNNENKEIKYLQILNDILDRRKGKILKIF